MDALQTTMHGSAAFKVQDRKPSQKRLQPVLAVPLMLLVLASLQAAPNLMPLPAKMVVNPGYLAIDSSFQIASTGLSDARLESAMRRAQLRIFRQLGFATIAARHTVLTIECREAGPAYPALGEDESYVLDVTSQGARLAARTVTGALRGLETFIQLIVPEFQVPAVHIEDHPRFPWRGLMLDVSRHWMPIEVAKRNLDGLAAVKLNVFHWHLSDDQGFRVESRRFPKLQELGSDGNFYTQAEIRQVVDYARDRGIRVIPEFDIPGHTTSWFVGYPELASAPGPYRIERAWGIFQPTIDPTREETYRFLDTLVGEMAALFPDPYFHIGGDEVDDTQWKNSAAIQKFAREHGLATSQQLHAYFNRRVQQIVQKHGKTMIGWDEVLAPGLAPDTVIQSWRGQESLADASKKGYRGILSFGYYLDHLMPTSAHYAVDPLGGAAGSLSAEETRRILGGEACMWDEYVSPETVDSRIWPRMAAIAERLWSPRDVADVNSMYARMEAVSRLLDWVGLQHRVNYEPMLERLGDGAQRILADVSEATGIEIRRDARKYTSLVDLNRFPDAVRPESELVRRLELEAAKLAPADLAELRGEFRRWSELRGEIPVALQPLAKNLKETGAIGLQALEYLESNRPAPETWIADRKAALDGMQKPSAEVVLAAPRPVRLLIETLERRAGKTGGLHRGH